MSLAGRQFRPPLWSILLTALGMSLFVALGLWQLQRADYKDQVQDRFEQRLQLPYQRYAGEAMLQDIEFRKLIVDGRFDNSRHLLLDNQIHRGRAGYQVLTPLRLRDADAILLVNRGWLAWGETRQPLPAVVAAQHGGRVTGIASIPSEPALRLGDQALSADWPQLIPYIDLAALQSQFSEPLLPWVLWLAPEHADGFVRDWNPVWMRPEKSRAYATQWFSFAALALVFFVILNLRKPQ